MKPDSLKPESTVTLSPSATALIEKFKREHGIRTFYWGSKWHSYQIYPLKYEDGSTELEAVRALCRQVGILCEL